MNALDILQSFAEVCGRKGVCVDSLAGAFRKGIEDLGFRYSACVSHVDPLHPPPNAIMIHSYPAAWVRRFSDEKLYAIDPVLQRAERQDEPFFWDRVFPAESLSPPQRAMLADAEALGIAHGFTFPIQLTSFPRAPRASCSVVPDGAKINAGSYFAVEAMAIHLVAAISRAPPRDGIPPVELGPRERQCILLIAQGKTDAEIARALGTTRLAAHAYVERLRLRLAAKTRMEAVTVALFSGLISVDDLAVPNH